MAATVDSRLARLAATDPTVAALARLYAVSLHASADRAWDTALPALGASGQSAGPAIAGQVLTVELARLRSLLADLLSGSAGLASDEATSVQAALLAGALQPLSLVEAAINLRAEVLAE